MKWLKSIRIGSGAVTQFHWDLRVLDTHLHCHPKRFVLEARHLCHGTDGIPDSALRAEGIQIPGDKIRSSSLRWKSKWFLWVGIQVNGQIPRNRSDWTLEARKPSSRRSDWRSPEGGHGDGPQWAEQGYSSPNSGRQSQEAYFSLGFGWGKRALQNGTESWYAQQATWRVNDQLRWTPKTLVGHAEETWSQDWSLRHAVGRALVGAFRIIPQRKDDGDDLNVQRPRLRQGCRGIDKAACPQGIHSWKSKRQGKGPRQRKGPSVPCKWTLGWILGGRLDIIWGRSMASKFLQLQWSRGLASQLIQLRWMGVLVLWWWVPRLLLLWFRLLLLWLRVCREFTGAWDLRVSVWSTELWGGQWRRIGCYNPRGLPCPSELREGWGRCLLRQGQWQEGQGKRQVPP